MIPFLPNKIYPVRCGLARSAQTFTHAFCRITDASTHLVHKKLLLVRLRSFVGIPDGIICVRCNELRHMCVSICHLLPYYFSAWTLWYKSLLEYMWGARRCRPFLDPPVRVLLKCTEFSDKACHTYLP